MGQTGRTSGIERSYYARIDAGDKMRRLLKKLAYANGEVQRRLRRDRHGVTLCEFDMCDDRYSSYRCYLVLRKEGLFIDADKQYYWGGGFAKEYREVISFDSAIFVLETWGVALTGFEDQLRDRFLIPGRSKHQVETDRWMDKLKHIH